MNYYERHLGDYAKDTGHLTMIEHGAYSLLLDRYYSTEQPIPADQAHRITRARTKEEKQAVDAVLDEFFELVDGAWRHGRADREIEKMQTKIKAAQENGRRGGRPKKVRSGSENETERKPTGLFTGSENETETKAHQTPDTRHQSPDTNHQLSKDTHIVGSPSRSGAVCVALRSEGIASVNPAHPDLIALLEDGAEIQEFVSAARIAREKGKGFPYVLGVVKGQREDARQAAASATTRAAPAGRSSPLQSFAERDREAGMQRWEQMTGRVHPDRKQAVTVVIDAQEISASAPRQLTTQGASA